MLSVHVDTSDLIRKTERMTKELEHGLIPMLEELAFGARARIIDGRYYKNHSGAVSSSFEVGRTGPSQVSLWSSNKVARFLDQGTRQHMIFPRSWGQPSPGQRRRGATDIGTNRVALRFRVGGRIVFAAHVLHPGTRARNFVATESAIAQGSTAFAVGGDLVAQSIAAAGLA